MNRIIITAGSKYIDNNMSGDKEILVTIGKTISSH